MEPHYLSTVLNFILLYFCAYVFICFSAQFFLIVYCNFLGRFEEERRFGLQFNIMLLQCICHYGEKLYYHIVFPIMVMMISLHRNFYDTKYTERQQGWWSIKYCLPTHLQCILALTWSCTNSAERLMTVASAASSSLSTNKKHVHKSCTPKHLSWLLLA